LDACRFRVQQNVEELLRRAHGGDFDDPGLGELKRQLQERINERSGRAIAEVIVTDLKLQHNGQDAGLVTGTAESVPWWRSPQAEPLRDYLAGDVPVERGHCQRTIPARRGVSPPDDLSLAGVPPLDPVNCPAPGPWTSTVAR